MKGGGEKQWRKYTERVEGVEGEGGEGALRRRSTKCNSLTLIECEILIMKLMGISHGICIC